MQNAPELRNFGQLVLVLLGHTATSGGSSDSDVNDCAANPAGSPLRQPVATTTPVQNCDNVLRKTRPSKAIAPVMGFPAAAISRHYSSATNLVRIARHPEIA